MNEVFPFYTLRSSHGNIEFDKTTGVVINIEDTGSGELANIYAIDVEALYKESDCIHELGEEDILCAGYWYVTDAGTAAYEEPAHDWIVDRKNGDYD